MNRLHKDLEDGTESTLLRAALAIGTACDQGALELIVERCGVEPDFYVRDMLTWALTRLPKELVLPFIVQELDSPNAQARSQALSSPKVAGGSPTSGRRVPFFLPAPARAGQSPNQSHLLQAKPRFGQVMATFHATQSRQPWNESSLIGQKASPSGNSGRISVCRRPMRFWNSRDRSAPSTRSAPESYMAGAVRSMVAIVPRL